jgi:hypothetical protein
MKIALILILLLVIIGVGRILFDLGHDWGYGIPMLGFSILVFIWLQSVSKKGSIERKILFVCFILLIVSASIEILLRRNGINTSYIILGPTVGLVFTLLIIPVLIKRVTGRR